MQPRIIPIHTNGAKKNSTPKIENTRDTILNLVFLFFVVDSFGALFCGGAAAIGSLAVIVGVSSGGAVAIGIPQLGQDRALSEISFPHSGHLISAMIVPPHMYDLFANRRSDITNVIFL